VKNRLQAFRWEGINKRGIRVKGELLGLNPSIIQTELKHQGIEPIKIKEKIKPLFSFKKRIKTQDIVLFAGHLSTLITAGIPLAQALEIILKGQNKTTMQALIQKVKNNVISGKTFHESLANHRKYFSELFTNLIKTGEMSGTLEVMLKRLADYMEKTELLKQRIRKAIVYPIIVLSLSLLVACLLLIFIIPQFDILFKSFGADLPFFTRLVINFSHFLHYYSYRVGECFGLGIALFSYSKKRYKKFQNLLDFNLLRIPIFGKLIQKAIISRVMRTLSTTLSAGTPLMEALGAVATIANNHVYYQSLIQIRDDIATGQQLHTAMFLSQTFPNMVVQMVAVGEESGTLDTMFDKVATFYEEDVNNLVDGLRALMEPILIVILGAIIGSFVLAMYLPIFRLGSIV
jgi:type IV pilus assembly protein PilC